MSKPPPKKAGATTPSQQKPVCPKTYQTRLTTAAAQASKQSEQSIQHKNAEATIPTGAAAKADAADATVPPSTPLNTIASQLANIVKEEKLETSAVKRLEELITYAKQMGAEEWRRGNSPDVQAKVSTIRHAIKQDLVHMYTDLVKHIVGVQETASAAVSSSTEKVLKEVGESAALAKDLASRVGKVSEATNKIASGVGSYRDALLADPIRSNRPASDPRVLSDIDRKARQILIEIFDTDDNNAMGKSLTELVREANEAFASMDDAAKPKDIRAVTALKSRKNTILLTLNSKEAVEWLRDPANEMAFTSAFSKDSHIRERAYNIIVPRIPITFDPKDQKHLREVEEVNSLDKNALAGARWIKPIGRRRIDQTHAYAIFSLASIDVANTLIRDGMIICGTKTRPKKQKREPIQCMKCRLWGHFATECQAEANTCGTCGEAHRTNHCTNKEKRHCVSCGGNTHASWDRNCPEFIRRCTIFDERNPQNAMPYYPTEHDWTLAIRPERIPLDMRFPGKYAVNSIPVTAGKHAGQTSKSQGKDTRREPAKKSHRENPNLIPLVRSREEGELLTDDEYWNWDRQDYPNAPDFAEESAPDRIKGWD